MVFSHIKTNQDENYFKKNWSIIDNDDLHCVSSECTG